MLNESQNIEYKESWRDEYLKWVCGINKIRQGLENAGLQEPKIENNASGTLFTIYRKLGASGGNGTVNGTVYGFILSQRHRDICDLINSSADITTAQMAEAINISLRTLKRDLAELQEQGIIQRIGSDKAGLWVVLKRKDNNDETE